MYALLVKKNNYIENMSGIAQHKNWGLPCVCNQWVHIGNSKIFRKRHNFASWTSTDSLLSNKLCVAVVLFASVLRNDSGEDGACDAKGKKKKNTDN